MKQGEIVWLVNAVLVFSPMAAWAADNPIELAVAAFQRGDLASAEETLRAELNKRPNDVDALAILGVVLDGEKKYPEADRVYRRAIALAPRSSGLLNNYGNHMVATGHPAEARSTFLRVLALDAGQVNAAVQLARIALENKAPAEALRYLDGTAASTKATPDLAILRMQAQYLAGRKAEADAALAELAGLGQTDAHLGFNLGVALASAKQYDKAEGFLSRALEGDPRNFEILYKLGLTAAHAGHNERAREVLQLALEQQPQNVEVLYDLAAVNGALNHKDAALSLLVKASQSAPDRADIQLLLARTTADLGYFGDAVQAWDRYIKLKPGDDGARRERAVAESISGADEKSLADLRWYLSRHPNDAEGHYDLGVVVSQNDPEAALAQFNRAIVLKTDFTAAYVARAAVRYRQGQPAAALPDLEFATRQEPENPIVLDHLGQSYMALDRSSDALPALRKAAELAPRNSTILLHLGHALLKFGQEDEAKRVMARMHELGPERPALLPRAAGIVDFLSLSPDEQYAQYRAGVERTVRSNPDNAEAEVEYLKLSLRDSKYDRIGEICRHIVELSPGAALLERAGAALLEAGQYAAAKTFLESALASADAHPELSLELAIATFHTGDTKSAMEQMDHMPASQHGADYYVARAEMLSSQGGASAAATAVKQALAAGPSRPNLYRRAAVVLLKSQEMPGALSLVERAAHLFPNDAEIALCRALALELNGQTAASEHVLNEIENRWPEWYKVWLAHGIVLAAHHQSEPARQMVETARALGAPDKGTSMQPQTLTESLLEVLQPAAR